MYFKNKNYLLCSFMLQFTDNLRGSVGWFEDICSVGFGFSALFLIMCECAMFQDPGHVLDCQAEPRQLETIFRPSVERNTELTTA